MPTVSFDSDGIVAIDAAGKKSGLLWKDLTEVSIRTTDEGPFSEDVFWLFYDGGDEPSIILPGSAPGNDELLVELQRRLPGFDNETFIDAMGSTSSAQFVLWKKK